MTAAQNAAVRRTLVSPVARVIIAVTIAGVYPDVAAARRISIITSDPDPSSANPLMMTGDPDGAAIGGSPPMFHNDRRGRGSNLDANIDGSGSLGGTNRRHDNGGKRQRCQTKRSDFHRSFLD